MNELERACHSREIAFRVDDETVAIAAPKRNIETWIHYLAGVTVNERDAYPKLDKKRDCKPAVDHLVKLCKSTGPPLGAPRSLAMACNEYTARIKPVRR